MLGGWNNRDEYPTKSTEIEIKARKLSIDPASIQHLISNYGAEAEHVVGLVEKQSSLNQRIIPDFPVIMAEVPFTVIGEMTVSLQDFMLRRTRLGLLNHKQAIAAASRVAEAMGKILGWDSYRSKVEVSAFEQEIIERKEEAGAIG
jgi:glycerol-3-phosphate dehydrogenase